MKTSEIEVCLSTRMTAPLANNRSARKSRWVAFFMSLRGIHEVDGPSVCAILPISFRKYPYGFILRPQRPSIESAIFCPMLRTARG